MGLFVTNNLSDLGLVKLNLSEKEEWKIFNSTSMAACLCMKAKDGHFRFSAPAQVLLEHLVLKSRIYLWINV